MFSNTGEWWRLWPVPDTNDYGLRVAKAASTVNSLRRSGMHCEPRDEILLTVAMTRALTTASHASASSAPTYTYATEGIVAKQISTDPSHHFCPYERKIQYTNTMTTQTITKTGQLPVQLKLKLTGVAGPPSFATQEEEVSGSSRKHLARRRLTHTRDSTD
jgi:hypothetical protein